MIDLDEFEARSAAPTQGDVLTLINEMRAGRRRAKARRLSLETDLANMESICGMQGEELRALRARVALLEHVCGQVVQLGAMHSFDQLARPIEHPAVETANRLRTERDAAVVGCEELLSAKDRSHAIAMDMLLEEGRILAEQVKSLQGTIDDAAAESKAYD